MTPSCQAMVAGHLCLDVIPDLSVLTREQFQRSFTPGRLIEIGPATFSTGGSVSNVGLALHHLGISTQLMGKVGDDLFGQIILQLVERYDPGLLDGMIKDSDGSSSYTVVLSPPGADRMLLHCPGANDTFGSNDINYERLRHTRLFHFGYPPLMQRMYENEGTDLARLFASAKAMGVTTSLDMAVPDPTSAAGRANWETILGNALPYVDIFLPSIEEILYMLKRELYDELSALASGQDILALISPDMLSDLGDELLAMGPSIVGLKLGYRGLYLRTAGEESFRKLGRARPVDITEWYEQALWAPCFRVDVVGTAGAGDATIAGFLSAFLRGYSPEEAITAAVAVGACNVEAADTLSGLQTWDDTMARIAGGWERQTLTIEHSGWDFDDTHQLWRNLVSTRGE